MDARNRLQELLPRIVVAPSFLIILVFVYGFIAYTATPLFIAGIAGLYPSRWLAVAVLLLAGAYSTFLLFVGVPVFMRLKQEQSFLYASSIWAVGLLVMVNVLVSVILHWHLYLTPEYV